MAVTYSSTLVGGTNASGTSILQNAGASTAGATSIELVTVVHRLPTTPNITPEVVVRSTQLIASGGGATFGVLSYNASQVVLALNNVGVGGVQCLFDVVTRYINTSDL